MEKKTISMEVREPQQSGNLFLVGEGVGFKVRTLGQVTYSKTINSVLRLHSNETTVSTLSPFDDFNYETCTQREATIKLNVYNFDGKLFIEGTFEDALPNHSPFFAISESNTLYAVHLFTHQTATDEFDIKGPSETQAVLRNCETHSGRPIEVSELERLFENGKLLAGLQVES